MRRGDQLRARARREMAQANRTPNVVVRSFCDRAWLETHVRDGALVISDCEGYEDVLFAAPPSGGIRTAVLVIETHDDLAPGVTVRLAGHLTATHEVRTIPSTRQRRATTRDLSFLPEEFRDLAVFEVRPQQHWLVAVPRGLSADSQGAPHGKICGSRRCSSVG